MLLKLSIVIFIVFVLCGISSFFLTFFPSWIFLNLIGVVVGVFALGMGLFHGMKQIINIVKRISFKCCCIIFGISLILLFAPKTVSGIQDIDPYLSKDYETITGKPNYIGSMGRKWREQTIEINQMELINTRDIAWENRVKTLEIKYLPRTKYVMSIRAVE